MGIAIAAAAATAAEPVTFNRDIRQILADNCYACHGPDRNQRKANLRLDTDENAYEDREGCRVIVPAKPEASELYRKLTTADAKKRMPPPKFGKSLSPGQVDLIRRWIEQGGRWEQHWSLIPPARPPLPRVRDGAWPLNPIDYFILARLEREGLKPSRETDRRTLLRRLSFDATGLPPEPKDVDGFLADKAADAYERQVDRLLASEHYGERMALYWLDLVRFADTGGYHSDNHRDVTPYRDYVIRAFNENMPFDRFTIEQLGGDLLPNSSAAQKIASGYNRLLMTTEEGGAQAKEYAAKYAADRVRNASSVWLGLTLGCTECHDHKYDPFKTRDFYRFAAFFADVQELAVGRQPQVPVPDDQRDSELKRLDERLAAVRATLQTTTPEIEKGQHDWEQQLRTRTDNGGLWLLSKPAKVASSGNATLHVQEDFSVLASGRNPAKDVYTINLVTGLKAITGIRLEALTHTSIPNNALSRGNSTFVLSEIEVEIAGEDGEPEPVKLASAAADREKGEHTAKLAIDGKPDTGWAADKSGVSGHGHFAVFTFGQPIAGGSGTTLTVRLKHGSLTGPQNLGRFRLALTTAAKPALESGGVPEEIHALVRKDSTERKLEERDAVAKYYRGIAPELDGARKELARIEEQKQKLIRSAPTTLIAMAGPPRMVRVLPRGNWLDDSGEVVTPGVPGVLPQVAMSERRPTRLDLAEWLVRPDHPLTARVFVNRMWKLMFGQGLVKSLDDFGTQGAWPTHLELLDWLAVEFIDSGWDVKHLLRLMATSRTYRQSSQAHEALRQRDPYNQWLARQGRFRLDAEMVRDNALAVSGLLVHKVGGRSVKPYQPAGYWQYLNFPKREYVKDAGDEIYRRGLYTYWQRTFIHPSLLAFDAPSREECTVERPRSNTPLQALVLLNDPIYVEASRVLAERMVHEGGTDPAARIAFAYRRALARPPEAAELKLLADLFERHLREYQGDPAAAAALLKTGDRPPAKDIGAAELAAWTSVARVILNLHETITRE